MVYGAFVSNANSYPPRWHRVPDTDQERYWDGTRWTDAFRSIASSSFSPGQNNYVSDKYNGQAIAAMVLGICSLVLFGIGLILGIVGIVLAANSIKKCQPKGPYKGRGMAIAGLICSIVSIALWSLVLIALTGA